MIEFWIINHIAGAGGRVQAICVYEQGVGQRVHVYILVLKRGNCMEPGLIHIYCGDGKGKTTAATGLAIRAAGCGKKVLFIRFLKNEHSGELRILEQIPEITMLHPDRTYGFMSTLSSEEKEALLNTCHNLWNTAVETARREGYDMLVADEFMAAYQYGLIPAEQAISFLEHKPEKLEVVLTGRNPDAALLRLADYVSEICKKKHPFDRGVRAREGIEY